MNRQPPSTGLRGLSEALGMWSFRRRRLVVVLALGTLVALSAAASALGGEFRQSFAMPDSETQAAVDLLTEAGFDVGGHSGIAVLAAPDVDDARVRGRFERFLTAIDARDDVSVVAGAGGVDTSADGRVALARLDFGDVARSEADEAAAAVRGARDALDLPAGAAVELGGDVFFEETPFSSEGFGLAAAAVILLLAFGSLLAMGLPIATALIGIGSAFGAVQLATHLMDIPPFTLGVIAMIGLGAGIDYALLIVTRYREELTSGAPPEQAVRRAMATAGRSTLFAGATVVTSLLGLLLVGMDDVRALALAAAAGVLFVMLASVTLLPALLGFTGASIDRFGLPYRRGRRSGPVEATRWYRWSRAVQRHPKVAVVGALAVILAVAAPTVSLRLGLADASVRPDSDTSRRAHDLVADGFGPGHNGPLFVAVALPDRGADAVLDRLVRGLDREEGVLHTRPVRNDDGGVAVITVVPATGPGDARTADLVHRLRGQTIPAALGGGGATAYVGGATAAAVDFATHNERVLPWFVAAVLAASFVLLLIVFRSVLVPIKAVALNLLTVGAAYGAVVAIFQWGWLADLLRLGEPGPIEAWVPMMLFAIVFGLSIDYEVFLLSRIRERYLDTGDNTAAVADGLARTARLITAGAAIMICVFGAFALSDERALQMLGTGLAIALALDATLVRLILVPATMQLAGNRTWWLPRPLQRLLPRVDVDGTSPVTSRVPPQHAGTR